jgi:KRAB domain-containing zinc finger protein
LLTTLKCNHCEKTFNKKHALNEHHKYSHSLNKGFKCDFCNYRTYIKKDLKIHINAKHTKEIAYFCNYEGCDFKTFWPTALDKHKKIKNH